MKYFIYLASSLFACSTLAADTEYFQQPEADSHQMEYSLGLSTFDSDLIINSNDVTLEQSSTELGVNYQYGISSEMSAGVTLSYSQSDSTTKLPSSSSDTEASGLDNILFSFLANRPAGAGLFYYGLDFSLSLEDTEEDDSGATTEENMYSGYNSADLVLGYLMDMGGANTGASLKYGLYQGEGTAADVDANTKTDFDTDPSMILELFYERPMDANLWGVAFAYKDIGDTEFKTTGGGTNPGIDSISLRGYSRWALGNGHFLADLTYGMIQSSGSSSDNFEVDGGSVVDLNLGYRHTF